MSDDIKKVQYELSLNDMLTGKLEEAAGAANNLEGGLQSVAEQLDKIGEKADKAGDLKTKLQEAGGTVSKIAEAFGIPTDLSAGLEFVKSATEEYQKLNLAQSLLKAGLESTQYAAGLTFEELKEGAEQSAKSTKFSEEQIIGMQSALLTFPAVTKQTFGNVSAAIEDMSTRSGQDLKTTAKMVGQALQDPAKGITSLGLNFSAAQQQVIKNLTETGHTAQAQGIIIQEMNRTFGGSAAAAANADVLFKYNQLLGDFKEAIGGVATNLLTLFAPALEGAASLLNTGFGLLKDFYNWCLKNKGAIEVLAGAIFGGAAAYAVYQLWSERAVIMSAIKTACFIVEAGALTGVATAVEFVNAMFIASPVGWIVAVFALLAGIVVYAYTHFDKFRAVVDGVWNVVKNFGTFLKDVFIGILGGLGEAIMGLVTLNPSLIADGLSKAAAAGADIGKMYSYGYNKSIAETKTKREEDDAIAGFKKYHHGLSPDEWREQELTKKSTGGIQGVTAIPGGNGNKTPLAGKETAGATGNKPTTINIKINDLVRELNLHSTTIQGGAKQIKDIITEVLLSAVNDSQRIAYD